MNFPVHALTYSAPGAGEHSWLPIGNGRMGALIPGHPAEETIALNEDTLYSGEPETRSFTPQLQPQFERVRALLAEGDYVAAEKLAAAHWLGATHTSFQPAGNLHLRAPHFHSISNYSRTLHFREGICAVAFEQSGVRYCREYLASHKHDVIAIRLSADRPGQIDLDASIASPHPHDLTVENDCLVLSGRAPVLAMKRTLAQIRLLGDAWKYPELFDEAGQPRPGAEQVMYESGSGARGMRFSIWLRVLSEGGELRLTDNLISIKGADGATLLVCIGTSFSGYDRSPTREGKDPSECPRRQLWNIPDSYDDLRAAHMLDFSSLFTRMDLRLGKSANEDRLPVNIRQQQFAEGKDPGFAALHFQYARYLMISASREDSQPMNLQGLWNTEVIPPWNCAYTLNINTQMNYWPAEPANLAECHLPFLQLIDECATNGTRLAREMFQKDGWVCFHHVGLWRDVQPSDGQICWAFWPMAQAWFCRHLWDHYRYSCDLEFLRSQAYPLIRGAAEFLLDWLQEDAEGQLITPAGISPENSFTTHETTAAISPGPTMDIALARDCFSITLNAAQTLGVDTEFCSQLQSALTKLAPYRIGRAGQLQEWAVDFDEPEPHHRHPSHLYGLYPGNDLLDQPEYLAAAKRSLELRGEYSTGWSTAWKIALRARLGDGERAYALLRSLLSPEFCRENLLNANPIFQIDANFGAAAGLLEMLLRTTDNEIELLPALPGAFAEGAIRGVKAPGGYELSYSWSNGQLNNLAVESTLGGLCRLRWRDCYVRLPTEAMRTYRLGKEFHFENME